MSETAKEIYRLRLQGYCCSQIMVKFGLDAQEDENPELLDAVAGLCGGMFSGLCCGTLTGAACLLSLIDKQNAQANMIPRLVEWFKQAYTPSYGGIDCSNILAGDPMNKFERCPKIVQETLEQCRQLLAEYGHQI